MQGFCGGASPLDLSSPCVRLSWAAILPAVVVVAALVLAIPLPKTVARVLASIAAPFTPFLTLSEAEAFAAPDGKTEIHHHSLQPTLWRTLVLSLTALLQTLAWLGVGSYILITEDRGVWGSLLPFLVAVPWLYACCRTVFTPSATPPYDLFVLLIVRLAGDILVFGGMLFDHYVYGLPLRDPLVLSAQILNLTASTASLVTIFSMPLGIPSSRVDPAEIVSVG